MFHEQLLIPVLHAFDAALLQQRHSLGESHFLSARELTNAERLKEKLLGEHALISEQITRYKVKLRQMDLYLNSGWLRS